MWPRVIAHLTVLVLLYHTIGPQRPRLLVRVEEWHTANWRCRRFFHPHCVAVLRGTIAIVLPRSVRAAGEGPHPLP